MLPGRPSHAYTRPGRLVFLVLLSLLLLSAAPYPAGPVLLPPPHAPEQVGPAPANAVALAPENRAASAARFSSANAAEFAAAAPCTNCVYLPSISTGPSDPRAAALALYKQMYLALTPATGWTGSFSGCNPGATSAGFQAAVFQRINYYRTMAGVPPLRAFSATYNQQNQEAAYMMAVNKQLNHKPPNTWTCFSQNGADGASSSNLAMGANGPAAIHMYMDDAGQSLLGHRRWVLYPQTQQMGTGDIPGDGSDWHTTTNAMKAWDDHIWDTRPPTTYPYVAWPPPGYVPYTVINNLWSLSYPGAKFSTSSVSVTQGGTALAITKYDLVEGYGENTLAWKINDVASDWLKPAADTTYTVTVTNVSGNTFTYNVIVFDPGP